MTIVVEFFILLKIIKTGLFSCFQYFLNNSAHCNKTTFKMLVMTILLRRNNTIISLITGFQEHGGWWKMPLAYWQTAGVSSPQKSTCSQRLWTRLSSPAPCCTMSYVTSVVMATPSERDGPGEHGPTLPQAALPRSTNTTLQAKRNRDILCNYMCSDAGAVAWQWDKM